VVLEGEHGKRRTIATVGAPLPARPIVVLVDGDSASASELVAGAIRDRGAGRLVGTKSFGKGLVQTMFPLPDGAAIKLTTARYLTPAGHSLDRVGLTPDVVVARTADAVLGTPGRDPQLDRALALLAAETPPASP
jgi:carboxyl-terminal processing protease